MKHHLLIGAASSGSGKTTFTLGLLRALRNRSRQVQPFKCGPDYIDTWHHRMAAGCPAINLDGYMMSEQHIKEVYARYAFPADVAVTEGVMGLFDGYDGMKGSSAELSRVLDLPVILVVNAKSTAYSVAPLLYGFKYFNPQIRLVGVVFNFVASESHYSFLRQASRDAGVEALGYLPKQPDVEIPSRHLGLSLEEDFCFESFADRIAALVERYVDIDRLLELCSAEFPEYREEGRGGSIQTPLRIAVAKDAAFNFMYAENIRFLRQLGTVSFFSPLHDKALPDTDFVYLPGGYPELFLDRLMENGEMRQSIRRYVEAGGKLLAECGGMMYLCTEIKDAEGKGYPMVGVLPQSATVEQMKLRLGYRTLVYEGEELRGHEFHYSRIETGGVPDLPSVAKAYTAKGIETTTPLYRYKNVLAGYTHLYWADNSRNAWFLRFLKESNMYICPPIDHKTNSYENLHPRRR